MNESFDRYSDEGNSTSADVSDNNVDDFASVSGLTQKELGRLIKRYAAYDKSEKGHIGITLSDCLTVTEFCGNKFIASIIEAHLNESTHRIHLKSFIDVCVLLSSKTPVEAKKNYLFQLVDVCGTGVLTHDEVFRMYKLMFGAAVSDDHILSLTFLALKHPDLTHPGEITKNEFLKMIPDKEVLSRMTVDFQLR